MSNISDLAQLAIEKCKERIAKTGKSLKDLEMDESEYEISKRMKEKRGL